MCHSVFDLTESLLEKNYTKQFVQARCRAKHHPISRLEKLPFLLTTLLQFTLSVVREIQKLAKFHHIFDQGGSSGGRLGRSPPLKPMKVTFSRWF